jgi:hypothetical protein
MKTFSSTLKGMRFFVLSLLLLLTVGLAGMPASEPVIAATSEITATSAIIPHHFWVPFGNGFNGNIQALYVDGSDVYVGGQFTDLGGVSGATNIARWDGSAWHALGTGLNSAPSAIIRVGSWLYAGGSFTDAGGDTAADNIARWNGSVWSSVGGNQLNSMVFCLATDGSNLYVGGQFTNAAGIAEGDNVAVWNGATWGALGAGRPYSVRSLAFYDSKLHAGGGIPWLSVFDGATWSGVPGASGYAYNVYLMPVGSDLYAGGEFTDAGGIAEADHVARWDGSNWHALGDGLNGDIYAVTAFGSDLIATGSFTDAGGNPDADTIARWDGAAWQDMEAGMTGFIGAFAWQGNDLLAGGYFDDAHGDPLQDNLIIWKEAMLTFLPMVIRP